MATPVIEIKIDIAKFRRDLAKAGQLIKNEIHRTLFQQGKSAKRFAKSLAPVKTGALRRGISFQTTPTTLRIISAVPKAFPYNQWVNQSPGFISLGPYRKANPRYNIQPGQTLVYGKEPAHWKWTGTPKYMTLTFQRLQRLLPKRLETNLRKLEVLE